MTDMTEAGGDPCRVTVIAPRMRLDVAVPQEVPLASLLPALLWHSGEELADEGTASGGWALQRAAEGPLDTSLSLAALGVRDGDILYLRTRLGVLPAPSFDDAADAITTTLRERPGRWNRASTRVAALCAVAVLLAAGAQSLAVAGGVLADRAGAGQVSPGTDLLIALIAAGLAGSAILAAAAASRALADAALATVLALGALPYALVAGLLALPGLSSVVAGQAVRAAAGPTAPAFLIAATAFLVTAALGAAAVGRSASMLTGSVAAGFAAVAAGLLAVATSAAGAAAATVSLALVATPAIAPVAYRVARLPRPAVPATPDELRQRPAPGDLADIAGRAIAADRVVTALVGATAVVSVAAVAVMLRQDGWASAALAATAAGLLVLRARLLPGIAARAWMLGAGLACLVLLMGAQASRWPVAVADALAIAAAVAAVPVARVAASAVRLSPPLIRAADLAELLATIATVPLALQVLGVFHVVRALGG